MQDRTHQIGPDSILCFATVRNEMVRLPYFLEHYRKLGVDHFLFVDNDSDDGTAAFFAKQTDVSVWSTKHSYRLARFGMDWLGWLQWQYGQDHWCLTVDADELLVYSQCDSRDLRALTTYLDTQNVTAFGALMLDMYPKGSLTNTGYEQGQNPITALGWFDGDGYRHRIHPVFGNHWIQGGVRDRVFFHAEPARAPGAVSRPVPTALACPVPSSRTASPDQTEKTAYPLPPSRSCPPLARRPNQDRQERPPAALRTR